MTDLISKLNKKSTVFISIQNSSLTSLREAITYFKSIGVSAPDWIRDWDNKLFERVKEAKSVRMYSMPQCIFGYTYLTLMFKNNMWRLFILSTTEVRELGGTVIDIKDHTRVKELET